MKADPRTKRTQLDTVPWSFSLTEKPFAELSKTTSLTKVKE